MVSKSYSSGFYCGAEKCDAHYLRFDSLLRHIKKSHVVGISDKICNSDIHSNQDYEILSIKSDNLNTLESIQLSKEKIHENKDDTNFKKSEEIDLSKSAQKFVANLRILSKFTGTAIINVINGVQCLLSDISEYICDKMHVFCKKQNISTNSLDFQEVLTNLNFDNLFENTDTLQKQITAVKNIYNYIDPVEILLGFRLQQYFDRKEQTWMQKKVYETCQYVSIIETLKLIMSHSSMRNNTCSESYSSDDLLVSFKDGITYKEHPFFQRYPDALRIQLYYDDIVVNNPLGSKVHPHKIGAFYFIIQNLPQYINSSLGGIHILSLCHTADIQKYGMKAILKPFLWDLNKLESDNGVNIAYNDTHFILRASIAAICADGLAAHQLLGFLSPSAKYFCRLCMINRDDFRNNKNLQVSLRTKQLYEKQLNEINTQKLLKELLKNQKKNRVF